MRSSNPVFTKPTAFQPAQGYAPQQPNQYAPNPYATGYGAPGQYQQAPYAPQQPEAPQGLMTIDDVLTKSAITMGLLFLAAAATFMFLPLSGPVLMGTLIVTGILSFVAVLVVSLRRKVSPGFVLGYAVLEGLFIGAFSRLFEVMYPGIVVQAIIATFVAAGVTLAAYKYFRIRVTGTFRKVVSIATISLAVLYGANLIFALFGVRTGIVGTGSGAGLLAMGVSAIAVVLAVLNLIMDFDYIEAGVRNGAPASESWRAAFGLTVTMVWLYTELLRIMSYFRD